MMGVVLPPPPVLEADQPAAAWLRVRCSIPTSTICSDYALSLSQDGATQVVLTLFYRRLVPCPAELSSAMATPPPRALRC